MSQNITFKFQYPEDLISWQDYKVTFTFKVSLSINFTFHKELLCFSLYETASDTWKEEMAIDQQNTELVPNNILN